LCDLDFIIHFVRFKLPILSLGGAYSYRLFILIAADVAYIEALEFCYISLSIYFYFFHNKPYSSAKGKNSGTGRTRLTALTAVLRNGKIKTKVVTTSTNK